MKPLDEFVTRAVLSVASGCGFTKKGRLLRWVVGGSHALIGVEGEGSLDPHVERFRIDWGIVPHGYLACRELEERRTEDQPELCWAMLGPALVPPPEFYAGVSPRNRGVDPVWGVSTIDRDRAQACGAAVAEQVEKQVLPVMEQLMRPGSLLVETLEKRNDRRLQRGGDWEADAIFLAIDSATDDELWRLRDALASKGYADSYLERVGVWIRNRATSNSASSA